MVKKLQPNCSFYIFCSSFFSTFSASKKLKSKRDAGKTIDWMLCGSLIFFFLPAYLGFPGKMSPCHIGFFLKLVHAAMQLVSFLYKKYNRWHENQKGISCQVFISLHARAGSVRPSNSSLFLGNEGLIKKWNIIVPLKNWLQEKKWTKSNPFFYLIFFINFTNAIRFLSFTISSHRSIGVFLGLELGGHNLLLV